MEVKATIFRASPSDILSASSPTFQQLVNPSHLWERLLWGGGGSQGLHISSSEHNNYTVTLADLLATFTAKMERLQEVNGSHLSAWKRHLGTLR